MKRLRTVFRKEIVDNLRDRRSLTAALFYPLLGPILLVVMAMVIGRSASEQRDKPLELPVVGAEHAPTLMSFLRQGGAEIQEPPADPEAAVRAGDADVVLVIPEGYAESWDAGQPATVRLVLDNSRQTANIAIRRTRNLLRSYDSTIADLRLMARGVSPSVIDPLAIETQDLATDQSKAAEFLAILPYFIVFTVFIGGMYLAIDSTAGERERGSLEPLLINPAARWEVVLGKYAAVVAFTVVALFEVLIAFSVVLNYVPLEKYLGVRYSMSTSSVLAIFLVSFPMALLAAALQIIIATFTRSFKEAQNYLGILPLVPALPGLFLVFLPVKAKLWNMLIPTFGQQMLINKMMRGEAVEPLFVAVASVTTLLVAALLVWVAARLYESEKVVFGR